MDSQEVRFILTVLGSVCSVLVVLFIALKFLGERKVTYRENEWKRVECERLMERTDRELNNEFRGARRRTDDADEFRREAERYRTELKDINRWRFVWFDPFERERRIDQLIEGLKSLRSKLRRAKDTELIMDGADVIRQRAPTLRRRTASNTFAVDELFRVVGEGDFDNALTTLKDYFPKVLNGVSGEDVAFLLHLEHFVRIPENEDELNKFFLEFAFDPPSGGGTSDEMVLEKLLEQLGRKLFNDFKASLGVHGNTLHEHWDQELVQLYSLMYYASRGTSGNKIIDTMPPNMSLPRSLCTND